MEKEKRERRDGGAKTCGVWQMLPGLWVFIVRRTAYSAETKGEARVLKGQVLRGEVPDAG